MRKDDGAFKRVPDGFNIRGQEIEVCEPGGEVPQDFRDTDRQHGVLSRERNPTAEVKPTNGRITKRSQSSEDNCSDCSERKFGERVCSKGTEDFRIGQE